MGHKLLAKEEERGSGDEMSHDSGIYIYIGIFNCLDTSCILFSVCPARLSTDHFENPSMYYQFFNIRISKKIYAYAYA